MKTRKSISGKDDPGKEVLSTLLENTVSSNTDSPSIVRKLRSRVITSDTEDDSHVRTRTPKSNRNATKENSKCQKDDDEVTGASLKIESDTSLKSKTPKRSKRLSAVNLFQIVEVKEEDYGEVSEEKEEDYGEVREEKKEDYGEVSEEKEEDYGEVSEEKEEDNGEVSEEKEEDYGEVSEEKEEDNGEVSEEKEEDNTEGSEEKLNEEGAEEECSEAALSDHASTGSISVDRNLSNEENAMPSSGVERTEVLLPEESEEDTSDVESLISAQNEEAPVGGDGEEEDTIQTTLTKEEPVDMELGRDSGSDDDAPETVSFSSSKNIINSELTLIADAIKKEKARRKDRIRKKIEMIRIQKAEKEERRKQKMKFLEVNVPERLAEDVASSLPDKPDIPTVKKSVSINNKRKNEEKEKFEPRIEEKKNKILKFDDYIPINNVDGCTRFGVVPLEVTARLPKPSSQSAAEFKQKALFGSRIQREPSKNLLIYRQKLSAAGRLQKSFTSSSVLKM